MSLGRCSGRAVALDKLNRGEEAVRNYDKFLERFSDASEPDVREAVAEALVNKGVALAKLGRNEEAIRTFDDVLQRSRDLDEPLIGESGRR